MPIYQSMQRVRFSSPDGYEKFKVLFGEVRNLWLGPLRLQLPVVETLHSASLALGLAAAFAIFRFRLGMLSVLAGSALAGILLRVAIGLP